MVINFDGIYLYILVFTRLLAMIVFNPVLSRRNVTSRIKYSFCFALTLIITPTLPPDSFRYTLDLVFLVILFKEVMIGLCIGYIFSVFYYILFFIGDFLDIQFGLSFSKIFDPGNNINSSISSTLINIIFVFYFFISNSHIYTIKIFYDSFTLMPFNSPVFTIGLVKLVISIFTQAFVLGLNLALPFIVTEFVVEISMGILMRLIPQINVFVINIQMKLAVCFILLFLLIPHTSEFINRYVVLMLDNMTKVLFSR